jgi:glycosyltransferase involved in cell wall biosynthesis
MTGSPPAVTVGVPVFNGGRFLAPALESLVSQSFGDFELIVSDNASTDETEEVSREFARRDPRVRYHRHAENVGLTANFNGLFRMARGRYFKWAAADDLCLPDFLARCVAVLDRDPDVVLAYPRARFIDGEGRTLDVRDPGWHLVSDDPAERLRYVLRSGHLVNAVMGVVRSPALSRTGLLPKYPGGDYCLIGQLCLQGKLVELPEALFVRRFHERSSKIHAAERGWLQRYFVGGRRVVALPYWNLCADHLRTIVRSGLPVRDRISLGGLLLRVMIWNRRTLWGDIRDALPAMRGRAERGREGG